MGLYIFTDEQVGSIKKLFHNYFNNSDIDIKNACLGRDTAFIDLYASEGDKERYNGYKENDILKCCFEVVKSGDQFTIKALSHDYFIKPAASYYAYGSRSVPFRKASGASFEVIIQALTRFLERLSDSLIKDVYENNIGDELHLQSIKKHLIIKRG